MKSCKSCFFMLLMVLVAACTASPKNYFSDFYESEELEMDEYIPANSNEFLKIFETSSLNKIQKKYEKKGYVVIGTSEFNGRWGSRYNLVQQAKKVGAEIAIVTSENTGDQIYISEIPYLQNHTVRHQGLINSTGSTYGSVSSQGMKIADFNANSYSNTTYAGTSTYQTMESRLMIIGFRTYNQKAVFMAKKSGKALK